MAKDSPTVDVIALLGAIDSTISKVHTQSLDLSFNELLDMHANDELDISPDYQRLFMWPEGARSRFIESLLLEMPVPPIYVVEQEQGRYMLIDGLQRISSYLHLRGQLNAAHLDPPVKKGERLVLVDCDIVPELNGKTWDDLGTALQIRLKRAFVRVEVVRKGSDPRFKYHMFKRLNTGGEPLTAQQVRNCTIRLLDARFNDFIIDLSKGASFMHCIESLTQDRRLGAFDQELVLRFFAMKNNRVNFKHDVDDFLTEYMEGVSDPIKALPFDYEGERAAFHKTFLILERTLADQSFTYANKARTKLTGGFSAYHYEAITVGLQKILEKLNPDDQVQMEKIKDELKKIKLDPQFVQITTGGGKNSPGPLRERIEFVEERLAKLL